MKWSRYNFLLQTEKKGKLLYNSYTNALIRLDDSLFDILNTVSVKKGPIEDSLQLFTEDEITFFQKNYILVDNDDVLVEIMHHQSMARIFNRKHLVLTIAPTQNCNFSCTYCYEKWRKSGRMDDQTENALIDYLKTQQQKYGLETINLTWYGGEPLLEYKRIASLGDKLNKLGIRLIENEIITNGFLFTHEAIKVLVDIGVTGVQITLDGLKDIHDRRRPQVNGQGSFDKIIENLDAYFAGEYRDYFIIAIRVNIDKQNRENYLQMHKWLNERYRSSRLIVYPGWIHLDDLNPLKAMCFGRNEATDLCLDLFKKYGIISEKFFPDDINMECLVRNPYSMIVGWQGEIYKCFEELGDKELIVGNINNKHVWNNYELLSKYSVGIDHYQDSKCRQCSYLPICRGGCPKRRLENKYEGKHNDCCTPFKGRLEDYIELYVAL